MKRYILVIILLAAICVSYSAFANFPLFNSSKETSVAPALADKMTATLKKLPVEGEYLNHIELIEGIRAIDGEIASRGEIKILVNFDWQSLPGHPEQRKALDNAAARIISAVFSNFTEITKLRVVIKTPKSKSKHKASAKVFSFTRATWELSKDNTLYDLNTQDGAANLLALGDYVVLTAQGWSRGY